MFSHHENELEKVISLMFNVCEKSTVTFVYLIFSLHGEPVVVVIYFILIPAGSHVPA